MTERKPPGVSWETWIGAGTRAGLAPYPFLLPLSLPP
jgi:hypothetical protein